MFGTKKKACSQNDAVKLITNYVVNAGKNLSTVEHPEAHKRFKDADEKT